MNPLDHLKKYDIVLGSASPRRKELLSNLDIDFKIKVSTEEEIIPVGIPIIEVPLYLAQQKADFIKKNIGNNYLLITADTIVIHDDQILGKPKNKEESRDMLSKLSGGTHQVVTGVEICTKDRTESITDITHVHIDDMSSEEISWYVDHYEVMDKAGSYGIQDWLGNVKVTRLEGSYYNVMGLPSHQLYKVLFNWPV